MKVQKLEMLLVNVIYLTIFLPLLPFAYKQKMEVNRFTFGIGESFFFRSVNGHNTTRLLIT